MRADTHPILRCASDRGHVLFLRWPDGAEHLCIFGRNSIMPVVFRRPRLPYEAQKAFEATLPPDITEAAIQESMHNGRYLGRIVARPAKDVTCQ